MWRTYCLLKKIFIHHLNSTININWWMKPVYYSLKYIYLENLFIMILSDENCWFIQSTTKNQQMSAEYNCKLCDKEFWNISDYLRHRKRNHENINPISKNRTFIYGNNINQKCAPSKKIRLIQLISFWPTNALSCA